MRAVQGNGTPGLTNDDCAIIAGGALDLPGAWSLHFDRLETGEVFARLLPPWSDGDASAFLIERFSTRVILTDRLSHDTRDHCSFHETAEEAVMAAQFIIIALTEHSCAGAAALH